MTSDEPRRLYRSESDRMISGVCGGIADYLAVDPAIVRIVFVVAVLANGAGLLVYLVLAIVLPKRSSVAQIGEETVREGVRDLEDRARYLASEAQRIASDVGSGRSSRSEDAASEDPTGGEPTADPQVDTEGPADPGTTAEEPVDPPQPDPAPPAGDPVGPAQPVDPGPPASAPAPARTAETRSRNRMVMGWLLVVVGGWLLLGQLGLRLPDWLGALLWPAVLIAVGLLLLLRRR